MQFTNKTMSVMEVSTICDLSLINLIRNAEKCTGATDTHQHQVHPNFIFSLQAHRVGVVAIHRQNPLGHEELEADCREEGMVRLVLDESNCEGVPGDVESRDADQSMVDGVDTNFKVIKQPPRRITFIFSLLEFHDNFFHRSA